MKKKLFALLIAFLLVVAVTPLFAADEEEQDNGTFKGSFLVGYRNVDVDGSMTKYKQHLNLETAPTLHTFYATYEPGKEMKKYMDFFSIYMHNLGGEPFQSFGVEARKYGMYSFKYERRNSLYFYEDILEGDHHDHHMYDFERTMDIATLNIQLSRAATLYLGFNRYEKTGSSETTLDWEHDEFAFDKPVEEVKNEYTIGLNYALEGVTFSFEEKIRDYENTNSLFLPGASAGFTGGDDPTVLNYLYSNMPYDFTSYNHTARVMAKPTPWLIFKGAASWESLEMNLDYWESADGVSYTTMPYVYTESGEGTMNRDISLYDFDVSLLLSDSLAVVGAFRYHDFDQDGTMNVDMAETMTVYMFNTTSFEAGLQYAFTPQLTLTAGTRIESRDVEAGEEGDDLEVHTTEQTGLYGNVSYNCKNFSVSGDYQLGTYDDPYSLASPTDMNKLKLNARAKFGKFFVNGSYMMKSLENEDSEWTLDHDTLGVRLGYHCDKIYASAGYRMMNIEQSVTRNLVFYGSPAVWEVLYEGTTNMFDAYGHLKLSKKFGLGAYVNYFDNADSWAVSRLDFKGFIEYTFCPGYKINAGYRYVDYQEEEEGLNDYSANILEFGIGYSW